MVTAATRSKIVRDMPEALWARAKAKAKTQGLTMRGLIIQLLQAYVSGHVRVESSGHAPSKRNPQ